MKKARIIGLIAILTVLVTLSGCDAILEAFFPEYGEKFGGDGQYAVGVWVEITTSPSEVGDPQLAGRLEYEWGGEAVANTTTSLRWPEWNWKPDGSLALSGYLEFYGIPEGRYRIAIWLEESGNTWPDWNEQVFYARWMYNNQEQDVFEFPNDQKMTWIDASAIVNLSANYAFSMSGQLIIDSAYLGPRSYFVETADPNQRFVGYSWDIYDSVGYWMNGMWYDTASVQNANFEIDTTGLTNGYYRVEMWLLYQDGTYVNRSFPLRILTEAANNTPYYLDIYVYGVENEPMFLNLSGYGAHITVFSPNGSVIYDDYPWVPIGPSGELAYYPAPMFLYNPTNDSAGDGDGVDFVEIIIDANDDGAFSAGDWIRRAPISLDVTDGGIAVIELESADFRPY